MSPARRSRRTKAKAFPLHSRASISLAGAVVLFSALTLLPHADAQQQEPAQRTPLGSLSATGTVQVNGSTAPAQSTIFAGDSLNTDPGGTATLTVAGRGTIKLYPQSEMAFNGNSGYVAELVHGTAVVNTLVAASGVALRVGDYVVGAAPGGANAAAMVRLQADGTGLVYCIAGTVQVVALQGDTSVSLAVGQSTSISTAGEAITAQASPSSPFPNGEVRRPTKHHRWRLIILGLVGGTAVATAVAFTRGGGAAISTSLPPSPTPAPPPGPPSPPPPSPSPSPTPPSPPGPTPTPPSPPPPPPTPPAPPPAPRPPRPPRRHRR
jgi:hypothetical protein